MKIDPAQIQRIGGSLGQTPGSAKSIQPDEFKNILEGLQQQPQVPGREVKTSGLKFSRHALERMHSRGISIPQEQVQRIEAALVKAQAKGAKDTLVIAGDKALVVNARTSTVVTVMEKSHMGEQIVTNIDSTVLI